ncbi:hypothetical protein Tco_0344563 [Tanacetum coccineum]
MSYLTILMVVTDTFVFLTRKLNPRYIGPLRVLSKVGTVAYRLELPQQLSRVHSTFHVSNLKKCLSNEPLDEIHIDDKLHFVEEPVEIMDREVKRLKQSRIPIVKVRWNSRRGPEFTWEREDQFRKKYLHLFTKTAPSTSTLSPAYVPGPKHPPSPEYVPGPEEPEQALLSPDYVPEHEYLEYLVPSDAEAPIEDQPLPDDASPTALSPGYVADSNPEEDPEEDPAKREEEKEEIRSLETRSKDVSD